MAEGTHLVHVQFGDTPLSHVLNPQFFPHPQGLSMTLTSLSAKHCRREQAYLIFGTKSLTVDRGMNSSSQHLDLGRF